MTDTANSTKQWQVDIVAPNGATGQFKVDASLPIETMIEQLGQMILQLRENDPEPMRATPDGGDLAGATL
jgi:hypothetical protein